MLARWLSVVGLSFAMAACGGSASPLPRATLLSEKGRVDEAVQLLRDYLATHPRAVRERRQLVRLEASRGQLGAAKVELERLRQELGTNSPIPFVELGYALEMAHRYDEALEAYDSAAVVAPTDPLGPLTGGLRAARWGELELAAPRLEEAVRRAPRDPAAWHALGVVQLSRGELERAERAYRAGLLADPNALENRIGLASVALKQGDLAAALVQYDAIVASRPSFADARLGRSFTLMGLGRFEEARRALDDAARLGASPEVVARQRVELARRTSAHPASAPAR